MLVKCVFDSTLTTHMIWYSTKWFHFSQTILSFLTFETFLEYTNIKVLLDKPGRLGGHLGKATKYRELHLSECGHGQTQALNGQWAKKMHS